MRRIRSKSTTIEMTVRRMVHSLGYRYRLHDPNLPGKPDLVFASRHKVIFVHGCFWHQHHDRSCKIVRKPKSKQGYGVPKLARNKARDSDHLEALNQAGWDVLAVWECGVQGNQELLRDQLKLFLG